MGSAMAESATTTNSVHKAILCAFAKLIIGDCSMTANDKHHLTATIFDASGRSYQQPRTFRVCK